MPDPVRTRALAKLLALGSLLVGVAALLGWALDVPALYRVLPGLASAKPNTALCFLLCSAALLLGVRGSSSARRIPARFLAFAALLIAVLTLGETVFGWDLFLDTLLFEEAVKSEGFSPSGRMSPATALCFVAIGLALSTAGPSLRDYCALPALAIALPAAFGYVYALLALPEPVSFTSMSIPTAVGMLALTTGAMLAEPEHGLTRILLDVGPVGVVARRALPIAVLVPLLMGWIALDATRGQGVSIEVAVGVMTAASFFALTVAPQFLVRELAQVEKQRSQAADRLERTETKFRDFVTRSPVGLFRADGEGELLEHNPAFAVALGFDADAELPRGVLRRVLPDGELNERLEEVSEQQEETSKPLPVATENGADRWVTIRVRRVSNGEDTGAVFEGSVLDVTRGQLLERRLEEAQRLEAIGRLAGGVAHDFNNLLSIIQGNVELIADDPACKDGLADEIRSLQHATERGAGLTAQLLAFGRKQRLEPEVLDLNRVVESVHSMLDRVLGEGVRLERNLGEELWAVRADRSQVEQILVNLVVNGRDALSGGGQITVTTANAALDATHAGRRNIVPGDYVMLAVSDSGVGMDAETLARVFEPFFTTKERGRGTGLGLATVYGIVQQSGGQIWAYSEPGRGSTFKVYLPRERDALSPEPSDSGESATEGGTETILLAEDDEEVRRLTSQALTRLGYRVISAGSVGEATRMAWNYEGPIHLILTDVVMPDGNGPELVDRIAGVRAEQRVLFTSGYTDDVVVEQEGGATKVHFLQKPFTWGQLAAKVRRALDQ